MQSARALLESRICRLVDLVQKVENDEVRAELTKHLCVLCSGLLEVACRDIIARYAAPRCNGTVLRFVETRLADLQSARVGKMHQLLACFDPGRADTWRDALSDEERDSVDSIVNNRHQIAHGRSIGLSFDVLNRYLQKARNALVLMERQFPNHKGA